MEVSGWLHAPANLPLEEEPTTHILFVTYAWIMTTTWGRVLVEMPTVTQLVKKFPTFYGTQRFTTVSTKA
jgi:hypothetical protein